MTKYIQTPDKGAPYIPTPEEIEAGKLELKQKHIDYKRKFNNAPKYSHGDGCPPEVRAVRIRSRVLFEAVE